MSYFFAFLLFWAPLCLVVGAKKYFFGALYKNSGAMEKLSYNYFGAKVVLYSNDSSAVNMYPVYDVPCLAKRLSLSLQTGYILNGVHVYGTRMMEQILSRAEGLRMR